MTLDELKSNLMYDPERGVFTRLKTHRAVKAGDIAGSKDTTRNGAIRVGVGGEYYDAHRLAWFYMTGHLPTKSEEVDHIDHDPSNNKWDNLRLVDKLTNMHNLPKYCNNTSGKAGVTYRKDRDRYRARIMVQGKSIHLGNFKTFKEACAAQDHAKVKYGFHANHGS